MMLLIRKSQIPFDFSAPKHDELRPVHAGTRHLQNGATVQVAEHKRHTQIVTRDKHPGNGSIVTDQHGKEYLVMNHRYSITTVAPIHEGKAEVNRDSLVYFNADPDYPPASDSTRTEPLYETGRNYYDELVAKKPDPDPRVAQADKEYAEWQAGQTPAPAPAAVKIPKNPKTGPQRVMVLRTMDMPGLQQFIADVDAATTKKELNALNNSMYERIPDLRGNKTQIGDLDLFWTVHDLLGGKEREIGKREKAVNDSAKREKAAGRETVVRERAEQAAASRGNNPELIKAIEGHKPEIAAAYRESVDNVLAYLIRLYGPKLEGISKTRNINTLMAYGASYGRNKEAARRLDLRHLREETEKTKGGRPV